MRIRIAVTVALFALLVILAQAGALYAMFEEMEEEFIDETLDHQIIHSIATWRDAPHQAQPNTPNMKLYRAAPEDGAKRIPVHLARLGVGNHEIFEEKREYHVAVREQDGARFILVYDVADHEARLRAVGAIIVTGALLIALAVMAAVYGLAGRLTRRLDDLAAQVDGGKGGASHVRPGMEREILAVARALDGYAARQAALLAREREFTANLSHELRTPLTAIRTDAEMISGVSGLPENAKRRALRIVEGSDQIAGLAGSLLMLAREMRAAPAEAVRLESALREEWAPLAAQYAGPARLRADMPPTTVVHADPALLALVLRNLLDNALRHGGTGEVVCRVEGSALLVCDDGPGFTADELPKVFDRFFRRRESAGHGLGLALVRHVCAACGWKTGADNAPEGGARIRVDFGEALRTA